MSKPKFPRVYYRILKAQSIPTNIKRVLLKDIRIMTARRDEFPHYHPEQVRADASLSSAINHIVLWDSAPSGGRKWHEACDLAINEDQLKAERARRYIAMIKNRKNKSKKV